MKADIISLQLNTSKTFKNGKSYDGHIVTYQPEPYEGKVKPPTERFIFGNSDVANDVVQLQVGDHVDIEFKQNGRYSDAVAFKKVAREAPQSNPAPSARGGDAPRQSKDDSISRAVALKEGVNVVSALVANGGYTAANIKKREFLVEEIIQTSHAFLPFLLNQETVDSVIGDDLPAQGEADGVDQEEI